MFSQRSTGADAFDCPFDGGSTSLSVPAPMASELMHAGTVMHEPAWPCRIEALQAAARGARVHTWHVPVHTSTVQIPDPQPTQGICGRLYKSIKFALSNILEDLEPRSLCWRAMACGAMADDASCGFTADWMRVASVDAACAHVRRSARSG